MHVLWGRCLIHKKTTNGFIIFVMTLSTVRYCVEFQFSLPCHFWGENCLGKWTFLSGHLFSGQKNIFSCRIILFPNVLNNNLNKCWVITKLSVCMSDIQHNVPVKLNPHSSGAALTYLSEVLEELRWRIRGSIKAREESRAAIIGERPDCPSSFPPPPPLTHYSQPH